jgi:hypothetical protein
MSAEGTKVQKVTKCTEGNRSYRIKPSVQMIAKCTKIKLVQRMERSENYVHMCTQYIKYTNEQKK